MADNHVQGQNKRTGYRYAMNITDGKYLQLNLYESDYAQIATITYDVNSNREFIAYNELGRQLCGFSLSDLGAFIATNFLN